MSDVRTATTASLGGAGIMAVCSCGAATGAVGLLGVAGIATTNPVVHPFFLGAGALLMIWGLSRISGKAALLAAAGVALFAGGALLAPASVMTQAGIPHPPGHLAGFALYVLGGAAIVLGFLTAYRPPEGKGGYTAAAGMGLAAGCSCCLVTGSLVGILGTFGVGMPWIYSEPVVFVAAMGLVTYGLVRLGGWRAAWPAPVGALVLWGGPQVLRALAEEIPFHGVNLRFIPAYLVTLAGIGLVLWSFPRAYRAAASVAAAPPVEPPAPPPAAPPPAMAGTGG